MRRGILCAALALLALLPASASAATRVGFWAGEEFVNAPQGFDVPDDAYWLRRDTSAYTPALWRALARQRVPLYFNLRYRRDFGPVPAGQPRRHDALPVLRRAQRLGLPLWAWIVVPYSDGYWSWEGNAAQSRAAVIALRRWAARHRLHFRGVALDSEPSIQETDELYGAFGGAPQDLPGVFDQTVNPARQCMSIQAYAGIIDWAHAHDTRIVAAAYPPVLDDLVDGRIAMQDALDVATLPPTSWDSVYFMAYRTLYATLFHADPGSGLVASYMRSARRRLGEGGQVTLGIAGQDPYASLDSMVHDVRVLATMHARSVPVFSLETAARAYGPAGVAAIARAARRPFTGSDARLETATSPQAEADRDALVSLDGVAVASTPVITDDQPGGAQHANAYGDCGVP